MPLNENPMRGIVLAGSVVLAAVGCLPLVATWAAGGYGAYLRVLPLVVLAAGAYLIQKPGVYYKVSGCLVAGGAVLTSSAIELTVQAYLGPAYLADEFGRSLAHGLSRFAADLTTATAVLVTAWGIAKAVHGSTIRQVALAAPACGAAYYVVNLVMAAALPHVAREAIGPLVAFGSIPEVLALIGAMMLVGLMCAPPNPRLSIGLGAQIWFWICFAAWVFWLIIWGAMYQVGLHRGTPVPFSIILLLAVITGAVGYLQLGRARRIGYAMVLLSAGVQLFGQLIILFDRIGASWLFGQESSTLRPTAVILSIGVSCVNPLITGLVLAPAWKRPAPPPPGHLRRGPLYKISGFLTLIGGLALFITATTLFIVDGALVISLHLFGCVGAAVAVFGLYALISAFGKWTKGSLALGICSLVISGLSVAFFALAVVMSVIEG
ncbi:MAG: hypothetical protein LBH68_05625 [Bifidobacteriaceae bacterium]|nr:hypothetical protein [Bifidobacteriaceae bacterium]